MTDQNPIDPIEALLDLQDLYAECVLGLWNRLQDEDLPEHLCCAAVYGLIRLMTMNTYQAKK